MFLYCIVFCLDLKPQTVIWEVQGLSPNELLSSRLIDKSSDVLLFIGLGRKEPFGSSPYCSVQHWSAWMHGYWWCSALENVGKWKFWGQFMKICQCLLRVVSLWLCNLSFEETRKYCDMEEKRFICCYRLECILQMWRILSNQGHHWTMRRGTEALQFISQTRWILSLRTLSWIWAQFILNLFRAGSKRICLRKLQ